MTFLAIKLFFSGILNRLLKAAGAAISWARRNPWPSVVIVLCVALAGTWWHDSRVIAGKDRIISAQARQIDAMKRASDANHTAQLAQKEAEEQRYRNLAHDADTRHVQELASARTAAERYIATHRVRQAGDGGGISPSSSTASGDGAQGGVGPGPETLMAAVSDEDIQICTTNTIRLVAVREWALMLTKP